MPERIRIAYILPTEVRGGVEEHVLSLVKGVDARRFQTFIVAPPKLLAALEDDLQSVDTTKIPLRIHNMRDWRGAVDFYRFLKRFQIHIVNTHMFIATFYYAPLGKLAGVPVLLETTHLLEKWRLGKGFLRRHSFIIDRIFYRLLNKVLAVSNACKRDLVSIKSITPEKIVVVQNGRDLANFKPAKINRRGEIRQAIGIGAEEYVFGVFARLNHQKGHVYLIQAVKLLKDRGVRTIIVCVGDGELQEPLCRQCHDYAIADQVFFVGFQKDMPGYLSMVDVMVLPSLYEGLPLCVIESLAMEKPVIATAVDGTPELVIPGSTGLLVRAKNPEELANAMLFAIENRDTMRRMGENGRRLMLERFSIERQIRETEELYMDLCREKGLRV